MLDSPAFYNNIKGGIRDMVVPHSKKGFKQIYRFMPLFQGKDGLQLIREMKVVSPKLFESIDLSRDFLFH
ncbi:hypothetical protein DID80_04630 [Candidatus Marinamargulisbacteria bacterium SCGC AAA071-K20]|nr:hypothetical protein DID80_04630 [Candidatus Marinamargulisbacteria bacterium SCGC AAA071-K20]